MQTKNKIFKPGIDEKCLLMGRRGNLNVCVKGNKRQLFVCAVFSKIFLKILINVGCTNDTFFSLDYQLLLFLWPVSMINWWALPELNEINCPSTFLYYFFCVKHFRFVSFCFIVVVFVWKCIELGWVGILGDGSEQINVFIFWEFTSEIVWIIRFPDSFETFSKF